jgi:hypothetical protein
VSGRITTTAAGDASAADQSDVALPARAPSNLARPIVRNLAGWLGHGLAEHVAADTQSWTEPDWLVARRMISIHGLAPHLVASGVSVSDSGIPASVAAWLIEQDVQNAARIERIHGELAALLAAASREQIQVMPLKGALLTTLPSLGGYRRPMSDIDILVRPGDREAAARLLTRFGYQRIDEANPRPTHDVFLRPGSRVVSIDEHPDNPLRIELHTEVVRHLWGWFRSDELTDALWSRATSRVVLGEPAMVPHVDDLLAHLAVHASSDLLAGRGRLVQWLDISRLAGSGARPTLPAHERVAYISLRLTERAIPGSLPIGDLAALEVRVPRGLATSVADAPLDDRSGLFVDYARSSPSSTSERWQRWRPTRRRLWAAYGDAPLPVSLLRHARRVALVATHRGR